MPHSFCRNYVYVVFSTKNRVKLIPEEHLSQLWSYLAGICKKPRNGCIPDWRNWRPRAPALLLPAKMALSHSVMLLKANSSRWMKGVCPEFAWQDGFGAFSVSSSNLEPVRQYIGNQKRHHERRSFEDEFRELLRRHGVEFDGRNFLG